MESNYKLRVAHIITQLELGGAQRNTLYTVEHLDTTRFEPCLISGVGGLLDEEAGRLKIPHFFVPTLVRPIRPIKDLRAAITIYRLLRHFKPDIVHTHSSKAGILGRIAAYLAGVPVIVHTFHGFGFTPAQYSFVRKGLIAIERFCALLSTQLIFVSEDNQKEAAALKIGPRTPARLIRSGIEMHPAPWAGDERRASETAAPSVLPSGWLVTYVGNFKPQKNPLDLVKIAEKATALSPDVHFLLVGDGEKKKEVERYIQDHNLAERVTLYGWKRSEDVRRILEKSGCFLMTSLWEGLPRAMVEAFAAKRPVVAYAANGVTDILKEGETGFLIPPGDVTLAAEKILWLKEHAQEAATMGERGFRRVETEFDIDRMVRQQEELYDKLFADVPLKEYYKLPAS